VGTWAGFTARLAVPDVHFDTIKPYGWIWGYCMPSSAYRLGVDAGSSGRSTSGGRTSDAGKTDLFEYGAPLPNGATMQLQCRYGGGDLIAGSQTVP
jgi:hypothetical protein